MAQIEDGRGFQTGLVGCPGGLLTFVKAHSDGERHTLRKVFWLVRGQHGALACCRIFVSLLGLGVRVMRTLFFRS